MDLAEIYARIEERLAALGISASHASKAAGKRDAIRNIKRAVQDGGREGVSTATLAALAPVLETTAGWLATGDGDTSKPSIAIMGNIGGGAEIEPEYEQVPPEGLDTIELPIAVTDGLIGFRVEGESMRPAYRNGDVVLVWKDQRRPTDSYIGEEVAVRTSDGRRFLKELHGTPKRGVYNLFSHNHQLIENVRIVWVGEIAHVVKASQLRRMVRHITRRSG